MYDAVISSRDGSGTPAGLRGSAAPPGPQGRGGHRPPLRRDGRHALPGPAAAAVPASASPSSAFAGPSGLRARSPSRAGLPVYRELRTAGGVRAPRGLRRRLGPPLRDLFELVGQRPGTEVLVDGKKRALRPRALAAPLLDLRGRRGLSAWPSPRTSTPSRGRSGSSRSSGTSSSAAWRRSRPNDLKVKVEALVRRYANAEIRNNTERFRYQTLTARYNTFNELWTKRLRARRKGKAFGVHGLKAEMLPPPPAASSAPAAARRRAPAGRTRRDPRAEPGARRRGRARALRALPGGAPGRTGRARP